MTHKAVEISKTRAAGLEVLRELCVTHPEVTADLLLSPHLTPALKAGIVLRHVRHHGRFPAACDRLWKENPPLGGIADSPSVQSGSKTDDVADRLLFSVLTRMEPEVLANVCLPGPAPRFVGAEDAWRSLLAALVQVVARDPEKQQLMPRLIAAMRDDVLLYVLDKHGQELRAWYPRSDRNLNERLLGMLSELAEHPKHFERRLVTLHLWRDWFPDPKWAEDRLGHWDGVRTWLRIIRKMREQERQMGGVARMFRKVNYAMAAHDLAECLHHAMPPEDYPQDRAERVRQALHSLGRAIAPDEVFWTSNVAAAIEQCLLDGLWPDGPLYLA